jgi:putative cell wall-binding protein
VSDGLGDAGVHVERVAGDEPVAASLALHSDVDAEDGIDAVFLVPSEDPEAALVATLAARDGDDRVLLVGPEGPTSAHAETLQRIRPRVVLVVADADAIAEDVVDELGRYAVDGADRLLAPTPVQAAVEAVEGFDPDQVGVVYVASAARSSVGDAVTGAAVAGLSGAPLLLVDPYEVPPATHTELERLAPSHVVVLGGPMSVSTGVRQALAGYLRPEEVGPDVGIDL